MTDTIGSTACDRCGDRYLRTELYALAPSSGDDPPAFEALLCEYCVEDVRRDVFERGHALDGGCSA